MQTFWFNDLSILYDKDSLFEVIPNGNYDISRKLNSIVRFSIYFTIIIFILKRDKNYLCVPFITMVITFIIYKSNSDIKNIENLENYNLLNNNFNDLKKIKNNLAINNLTPTKDNPVMNPPLFSSNVVTQSKNKNILSDGYQDDINNMILSDLPINDNDLYGHKNNLRQYYTMPKHDQSAFSKWCYGNINNNCKSNSNLCTGHEGKIGK